MAVSKPKHRVWEFGPFRLDESERLLMRDGSAVALTPKVFDTLVALVEQSGRLVEKDEVIERLWPDTFVEEGALTRNISDLRKALGEEKYVETVPKRGYRFVAAVREVGDESAALIVEKTTEAHLVIEEEEDDGQDIARLARPFEPKAIAVSAARSRLRPLFLVACLLVAGLALALLIFRQAPNQRSNANASVKSIAVLPFKPLTSEGGDEYLGLGITDTLITKLSNVRQIIVRPTGAVQKYAERGFDPVTVGREQRVEAVLDGSVQKLGEKVRVTVRLIETGGGTQLWGYQCDQYCTDIFSMQDAVSEQVATALLSQLSAKEKLSAEEKRLLAKRETERRRRF